MRRLEHLGDTVLSLVVTGLMREVFPCLRVGPSTVSTYLPRCYLFRCAEQRYALWQKIRALVVGNPTLAHMYASAYRSALTHDWTDMAA